MQQGCSPVSENCLNTAILVNTTAKFSWLFTCIHLSTQNRLHLHLCTDSLFLNLTLDQVSAALVTLTVLAETYLWRQDWQQQLLHCVPDLLLQLLQTAELLGASAAAELASEPQPAAPAALLALALTVASGSAINTLLAENYQWATNTHATCAVCLTQMINL